MTEIIILNRNVKIILYFLNKLQYIKKEMQPWLSSLVLDDTQWQFDLYNFANLLTLLDYPRNM